MSGRFRNLQMPLFSSTRICAQGKTSSSQAVAEVLAESAASRQESKHSMPFHNHLNSTHWAFKLWQGHHGKQANRAMRSWQSVGPMSNRNWVGLGPRSTQRLPQSAVDANRARIGSRVISYMGCRIVCSKSLDELAYGVGFWLALNVSPASLAWVSDEIVEIISSKHITSAFST